jgi:Flp pilus assembly protein TadG
MRSVDRKRDESRSGNLTVELAVVLPFLLALLLGAVEVGRALDVQAIIENAVGVGARQASAGQLTNSQVQTVVINSLKAAGLNTTRAVATASDTTSSSTDVSLAAQMDVLQVNVTIPFLDVRWGVSGFFVPNDTVLSATSTVRSAKVDPYPTNIPVPAGY